MSVCESLTVFPDGSRSAITQNRKRGHDCGCFRLCVNEAMRACISSDIYALGARVKGKLAAWIRKGSSMAMAHQTVTEK